MDLDKFRECLARNQDHVRSLLNEQGDQRHPLMRNWTNKSLVVDWQTIRERLLNCVNRSQQFAESDPSKVLMPRVVHRIWLTSDTNPFEPPEDKVNCILETARDLGPTWMHILWVQDMSLIPKTVDLLTGSKLPIEVKAISGGKIDPRCVPKINVLIAEKKFTLACDILRMAVLHRWGGVYADIGIKFGYRIAELMLRYDYAFIFWKNWFFQTSLMAAPPNSHVTFYFLEFLAQPRLVPLYMVGDINSLSEVWLLSGPLVTYLVLNLCGSNTNLLMLAANVDLISWGALRSWYALDDSGKPQFGSQLIHESRSSLFRQSDWVLSSDATGAPD